MRLASAFFLLLCYIIASSWVAVEGYKCIHDQIIRESRKRNAFALSNQMYPAYDFPKANNTQPLRITFDLRYMDHDTQYTCYNAGDQILQTSGDHPDAAYLCTQADVLSTNAREYLVNTLLEQARTRLQHLYSVVPIQGPAAMPGTSTLPYCGKKGVFIPPEYIANGVNDTDLLVFVTIRPTEDTVLAYALACVDDQHYRAVAGLININPAAISTDIGVLRSQLATVEHELTHVLGLSDSKYPYFRNEADDSNYAADGVDGFITSPEVTAFVRSHFACDTLIGAQIEDAGGSGTSGSHWEKSVFMNEYMTGSSVRNPVLSKLTTAYFRDSGWYYPHDDYTDALVFGYQQGCPFTESCTNWPTTGGYRCTAGSTGAGKCTFDLQGKGTCDTDTLTGASCPYIRGYSNGWCIDPTEESVGKLPIQDSGEEFCDECRCFVSSLFKRAPTGGDDQLVCYKTACVNEQLMKVQVDSWYYDCPAGSEVAIKDYGGSIKCPDPILVCLDQPDNTNLWPVLLTVQPDNGEPGTTITMRGRHFTGVTDVYIAGDCKHINVVNDTYLVATLPKYEDIKNPSNFLKGKANIYIRNNLGYNSFNYRAFNLEISLSKDLLRAIGDWLADHWYVPLIAGLVIIALIFTCWYCRRDNIKNREKSIELARHRKRRR